MNGYIFIPPKYEPQPINPMALVRSWDEAIAVLNELKKENSITGYLFTLVKVS